MIAKRSYLNRAISILRSFDPFPTHFLGLQMGEEKVEMYRSGDTGFAQTDGYTLNKTADFIVSFPHFRDSLANLPEGDLDLHAKNGSLAISTTAGYHTELMVHTGHPSMVWSKSHKVGTPVKELPINMFQGVNPCFTLVQPPVLRADRLLFPTAFGVVFCDLAVPAYPYPQEGLIRLLNTAKANKLMLSDSGYWLTAFDGFKAAIVGHRIGDALFDLYNRPGQSITTCPADRLIQALESAYKLSAEGTKLMFADSGVTVRDEFGQDSVFSLGSIPLKPFSIHPKTGDVIASALSQAKGDEAVLSSLEEGTYSLRRGTWEVVFKVF